MSNTNQLPSNRRWQRLGNTLLDLAPVVKIEFERPDARLFVISGEALLMTAWSESRAEITALKQLVSEKNGWVIVATEPHEADAADYPDGDPIGSDDYTEQSLVGGDDADDQAQPDTTDVTRPLRSYSSDHRVRLSSVDRLVYISTPAGKAVELFTAGVFLGQVSDPAGMEQIEIFLDR